MEAYIEYLNKSDKTVLKALEVLDKGESFPKAPERRRESESDVAEFCTGYEDGI